MMSDMPKHKEHEELAHFDLIRKNETVTIESVFMFNDSLELYSFLKMCKDYNCTIFFENEGISIPPNVDEVTRFKLFCYNVVLNCREIGDAYVRYMGKLAQARWIQGEHKTS